MILSEETIQKKNRTNYEFKLQCDFCDKLFNRVHAKIHADLCRSKKFHFCSLACTRSSLSKGKYRNSITESLSLPTFEGTCSVCGLKRQIKEYDLSPEGFFFCCKKCVYVAQRQGGATYEVKRKNCLGKYSVNFPMTREEIKEKRRQNCIEKYGVDSVFQLDEVKEKMRETSIARYGVEVYSKTEGFKQKIKETCVQKFGYTSPIENPEILEKRNKTMIERWGGPSTFESPALKSKIEETMLSKYGHRSIATVPTFISASMDKKMLKSHGKTWQEYIDELPEFHQYRREVDTVTRRQNVKILLNFNNRGVYHLDHKFSVAEGFKQKIPPEIIGNIVNLEFIKACENVRKGAHCSISKDRLLSEYARSNKGTNQMINKKIGNRVAVYTAAGWFNPTQAEDLARIENIIDSRADWIDIKSPRRIFVCPPDAPKDVQESTFSGNLEHIKNADFLVASTVGPKVDVGTVWECGYAFAVGTPIVYICANLPKGMPFNLMLARSAVKVCLSYEQLEDYLDRCNAAGQLLYEPYDKEIE